MVEKSKTTTQIRKWFASEWRQISNDYAEDYEEGNLKRLEMMFGGLAGEKGILFFLNSPPLTKTKFGTKK